MNIRRKSAYTAKRKKEKNSGNRKTVFAVFLGFLIAAGGILFPLIFFSKETQLLVGRHYTVSVLSSDSVHTVTRDLSFTLDDYAFITEMTQSGSVYYSEPAEAQLSMREASNAAGEILKALLPGIFTGDVHQSYALSSAILTSNIQSSEEAYDYRQSFWYVDISYPDYINDVSVSCSLNAVNGKAWTATVTFPLDSAAYDSYGIRVADYILDTWGIASNLFYMGASVSDEFENFAVNVQSVAEAETDAAEEHFYAEYITDECVMVYNAADFYERLGNALQAVDGMTDFMVYLYENYLDYLGIPAGDIGQYDSPEIIYCDDWRYGAALENCRELLSMKNEMQATEAADNYLFAKMYDKCDDTDAVLLDTASYEEVLKLLTLLEYPYPSVLDASLVSTEATTGLTVTVNVLVSFEDLFVINVSLGMDE